MNKRQLLDKQGYVTFQSILSAEEVTKARNQLKNIFSKESSYPGDINNDPSLGNIFLDPFSRYTELKWILFHPNFISALKSTLGNDFVFLPEMAIHDSGFGGWHKDTSSQEARGLTFQWEKDFLMVQVGIYLQDNTVEYGGGLEVVPYSHKMRDRFINRLKPGLNERLRNKLYRLKLASDPFASINVPSKAGDMVIFNLKLDHKASSPGKRPIPEDHRKFSIFCVCSVNNKHANFYRDFIASRPDYYYLENHHYPSEIIEEAQRHSVNLLDVR